MSPKSTRANGVVRKVTFKLELVDVALLRVDYAPPHGEGYARPLSQGRLEKLRREWDPLAVAPMVVSRRDDGGMYVIDGNHRRVIAYEKGADALPAMVHSGLDRTQEADLYTKLGTVYPQTPATRFRARWVSGDPDAIEIMNIIEQAELELDLAGGQHRDSTIQAVSRTEWIYARGGAEGLSWVLNTVAEAFEGVRRSLDEEVLEGFFQFWVRYSEHVKREVLVDRLRNAGILALEDRTDAILRRVAVRPGQAYGQAIQQVYNLGQGKNEKLATWLDSVQLMTGVGGSIQTFKTAERRIVFKEQQAVHAPIEADDPAPQQLSLPA